MQCHASTHHPRRFGEAACSGSSLAPVITIRIVLHRFQVCLRYVSIMVFVEHVERLHGAIHEMRSASPLNATHRTPMEPPHARGKVARPCLRAVTRHALGESRGAHRMQGSRANVM